jgi:hypothetical protein
MGKLLGQMKYAAHAALPSSRRDKSLENTTTDADVRS